MSGKGLGVIPAPFVSYPALGRGGVSRASRTDL